MISVIVTMRVMFEVEGPRHHENAPAKPHHFDFRPIETRQHRAGDDLVDRAQHRLAAAEIEHPVHGAEQRIEFMGAEQHGQPEFFLKPPDDFDHAALAGGIEIDQRFVEQQQAGMVEQGLRQQQALPLASRHFGQRPARQIAGADHVERPVDVAPLVGVEARQAPAAAAGGAGDAVPAGKADICQIAARLRHIADRRIAARRGLAEHADGASLNRDQPENGAHERGFAGAVGPEHADELALCESQNRRPRERCVRRAQS